VPDRLERRFPPKWHLALLMPLAALVVHQLRYYLAYGNGAGPELSAQGHSYLTSLTPWIVSLAALALGGFLIRLARAWASGRADQPRPRSTLRLWAAASVGLLAIYVGQELLEGFFATGHAPGIRGVFGDGGWWALFASLLVGALLALCLRGARAVVSLLAGCRPFASEGKPRSQRNPTIVLAFPRAPLAQCAAERAPPARPALSV
jgi:hypothetical protein